MTDLDPDAQAYLERLSAAGPPPLEDGTPEQARAAHVAGAAVLSRPGEPVEQVRDERVGGVPVRTYAPAGARGTVVWAHGGGWVVGTLDTYDGTCRALARAAGATVVAVDYDLAPGARHPHQAEQVGAVLAALPDDGPVALAGDSAGGHLAVLAATRAARPLAALALVYPVVRPHLDTPSAREHATGKALTTAGMRWYWSHYAPDLADPGLDLLALDLSGLPPALVLTAGHDPLRDEGLALAGALEAAGVSVTRSSYDGQVHGFFRLDAVIGAAGPARQEVGAFLRAALG